MLETIGKVVLAVLAFIALTLIGMVAVAFLQDILYWAGWKR